jgi:hypothetical protein
MIEISQVATGALANAISATAGQLVTALRPSVARHKRTDYDVASSFNSYELTERALPSPPEGLDETAFLETLTGNEVQALIQELLAVRLSDAPERTAAGLRQEFVAVFSNSYSENTPDRASYTENLFDNIDAQIADLVVHISTIRPELLHQIRSEAYFTRLNATVETIERHLAASRTGHDPAADREFLDRYRRHIVQHHGVIEPPDFDRRRRVPIRDIYVEPTIVDNVRQGSEMSSRSSFDIFDAGTTFDIFHERAIDRTVLLGNPGGGKTTASQVILYRHATNEDGPVPFLVTLRNFAANDPPKWSILEYINDRLSTFYQCAPPTGLIERLLLGSGALIILDGLDELVDVSRRTEVSSIIEQFCVEYPLSRVLVTSRVVGYDEARLDEKQFSVYRIEGFDNDQVQQYTRKWFSLEPDMSTTDAEAMAGGLVAECSDIADLRSNPLMLALICILYRGERSIPRKRTDVYEKCAELLFRKWDAHRRIYVELKARHLIEPALRYLAYWLLTNNNSYAAVTRHELIAETATYFQGRGFDEVYDASSAAEEFVDFCRGRAWVFSDVGSTATGEQLYTFTHRTFLEYFAACYLASINELPEKLAQAIAPRAARGEWDMVAQLAVQIKDRSTERGAERIFNTLIGDRRRRSHHHRLNILAFLARCLGGVQPRSSIVASLTREIVKPALWHTVIEGGRDSALMTLIGNSTDSMQAVATELLERIDAVVKDSDPESVVFGLILACRTTDIPSVKHPFWKEFSRVNCIRYSAEIVAAAGMSDLMLWTAYENSILTATDVIDKSRADIGRLFRIYWFSSFRFGRTSPLAKSLETILCSGSGDFDLFEALGRYLHSCDKLPIIRRVDSGMLTIWLSSSERLEPEVDRFEHCAHVQSLSGDEFVYLGLVMSFAVLIEVLRERTEPELISTIERFAAIDEFIPFALCRLTGRHMYSAPALSVGDRYRKYFIDWANRATNFVQKGSTATKAIHT